MKLIIQIPCHNEREQLPATLADLPRSIPGIDQIEVLVIDDGSTDGTVEVAERLGVDHVVRLRQRRGLAAAFMAGVDACLRLGADIIVNTDGDNQYCGADVAKLVEPILAGKADVAIGDRQTHTLAQFSRTKRFLQRLGTHVVRRLAGVDVSDATSGFRAIGREAALRLFVHNGFTYTLETLLQAGNAGLRIENVPVRTNSVLRPSRLFRSTPNYLWRSVPTILRGYLMYRPVRSFGCLAAALLLFGLLLVGRFLYYFVLDPSHSGHVQSLLIGVGSVILAFLVTLMALLSELIASNRRILEEVLVRVRRLENRVPEEPLHGSPDSGSEIHGAQVAHSIGRETNSAAGVAGDEVWKPQTPIAVSAK